MASMGRYEFVTETVEAIPLAVVRYGTTLEGLHATIRSALEESLVYAHLQSVEGKELGFNVFVYYPDTSEKPGAITLEVGVQTAHLFEESDEVRRAWTPAGNVARTVHLGPYEELGRAHDAIQKWCAENEHALAGPCWEIYGHWSDDPAERRTDVVYLLSRR